MTTPVADADGYIEVEGSGGGTFIKFKNFGESASGTLKGFTTRPNKFTPGKNDTIYTFTAANGADFRVQANPDLLDKLSKVGIGSQVKITYAASKPIPGKPQPMKVFKVSAK